MSLKMPKQGKRKIGECVHCGKMKPISDDDFSIFGAFTFYEKILFLLLH
jgi:hypothetical protein